MPDHAPSAAQDRERELREKLVLLQQMAWSLYIGIQDALRVPSTGADDEPVTPRSDFGI